MNHISTTDRKMETKQLLLSLPDMGFKNITSKNLKSKDMNIIGRLTKDATVNTLSDKRQVVNFSVATDESYRDKKGERVQMTTYFDCSYWIGPAVAKYLTKGTLVELDGRVNARAWINQSGEAKAALNFHTSQIKFHSSSRATDVAAIPAAMHPVDDLPF